LAGLQSHGAENGAEVLLLAGLSQPDLILMDSQLDTVDSLRACKWLKQSRFAGNPEIIFLTGESDRASIVRGMDAGGDDWINKPFKADEGLARIRTYLEMRRLRQDLASRQSQSTNRLESAPEAAPAAAATVPMLFSIPDKNSLDNPTGPRNELSNRLAGKGEDPLAVILEQNGTAILDESAFRVAPVRKDLAPLLRLASWIFTDQASHKDINLKVDAPISGLLAMSDEILIQRVLENLLSNAIRFSPPGTTVTLGARDAGDRLRIWVDDEGLGVPAEKQVGLFGADLSMSGKSGHDAIDASAGLGACKRIITAHGGIISLQNRAEGGAHFEFCLPTAPIESSSSLGAAKGQGSNGKSSIFASLTEKFLAKVA
jgi:CheY-like chemotaxis protein